MSLGAYDILEARGDLPEPVWPDFSFEEILKVGHDFFLLVFLVIIRPDNKQP